MYSLTVQDRFADARALPSVDSQQDWTLVAGKEENGWTIVSFTRALQTGDTRDRDIVQVHTYHEAMYMHMLDCPNMTSVLCTAFGWLLNSGFNQLSLSCSPIAHTINPTQSHDDNHMRMSLVMPMLLCC